MSAAEQPRTATREHALTFCARAVKRFAPVLATTLITIWAIAARHVRTERFVVCTRPARAVGASLWIRFRDRQTPQAEARTPTKERNDHGPSVRRVFEIAVRIIAPPRIAAPAGGCVRWRGTEPAGVGNG